MKFVINSRYLPKNQELLKTIDSAAKRLYFKLKSIDLNSLNISEYVENYFSKLLKNLIGTLQKYSYLLSLCLVRNKKPLKDFIFVDYGGGSGIFSMLAKEIGVGTVIYNDIYEISCNDARMIANSIGNTAEEYICGEIRDVINYLNQNSIQCDALGSFNVIEHIYDIDDFFHQLGFLSEHHLTVVLGTGANPLNPILKRLIVKHHYNREFIKREKKFGHKEGDTLDAYTHIRTNMIKKFTQNNMDSHDVDLLVRLTRGLKESDILKCVKNYVNHENLPINSDLSFPSNTCDPYTGNWAERLMNPYKLLEKLKKYGFDPRLFPGIYEFDYRFILKIIGRFATIIMKMFPSYAINLALYYIIYGFKN